MKIEWVENNKWDKIQEYIESHPNEDFTSPIINGNNILHLSVIYNKSNIVSILLNKHPELFDSVNKDGNNALHLCSYYGNYKLCELIVDKLPHMLNVPNNIGNTPLFYIIENHNLFDKLLKITSINHNHENNNRDTLLTYNIKKSNSKDDTFYKNIISLINNNVDLNVPDTYTPLMLSIIKNKFYIFKKLIDSGADVNKPNKNFSTPLIIAVNYDRSKMISYLIKNGANVNNNGPEGDDNPLNNAIQRDDIKLARLLIDSGYNVNHINRYLETPLHIALDKGINYPHDMLFKMLYKGDLTKQNIDGVTPLHILLSKHNWKNYSEILKNKKLDIFIKDTNNTSAFSYIENKDLTEFMNIVGESYLKQINKKNTNPEIQLICSDIQKNKNECFNNITKQIIQTRRSYPLDSDFYTMINFKLVKGIKSTTGKFNSDSFHNLIYTVNFLLEHEELIVPFKFFSYNIAMTNKIEFQNLYRRSTDSVVYDLVSGYTNFLYELSPYLIVWRSDTSYYIDKYMHLYVKKLLLSNKIRFIYFKLTLVASSSGTHANILLYDKKNNTMERFDPYGYIPYLDIDKLDSILHDYFNNIFPKNFKYYSPKDYMGEISFQTISNDGEYSVKRLGDPIGYCLAWTFWYIDMRLNNPDMHPKKLVAEAIDKIVNSGKQIDGDYIFINFIREYASLLDSKKNKLLVSLGIDEKYIYNMIPRPEDEMMISNKLSLIFSRIMSNRL